MTLIPKKTPSPLSIKRRQIVLDCKPRVSSVTLTSYLISDLAGHCAQAPRGIHGMNGLYLLVQYFHCYPIAVPTQFWATHAEL
jgi:hypothetical protein